MSNYSAIIVSAGLSTRFNGDKSKILTPILGKPLYKYSVDFFTKLDFNIILVVNELDYDNFSFLKDNITIVIGGATRTESVLKALDFVHTEFVFIHDGARPILYIDEIQYLQESLNTHSCAYLAHHLTDSLKNADSESMERDLFHCALTPQAFHTKKIRLAYELFGKNSFDDDVSIYKKAFPTEKVSVVFSYKPSQKVTYQSDLNTISAILGGLDIRIGHSFDVHRLAEGLPLFLGGIKLKSPKGSVAHSDGDCLLHAIGESLLGALALGDLGTYFPNDAATKGISSKLIIEKIMGMIDESGYTIINIDTMVYLETPKIQKYNSVIRKSIAAMLSIDINQISVKATTYETLGSIGQNQAVACESTVLLRRKKVQ